MAVTTRKYIATIGQQDFLFDVPYLEEVDVKVFINGVPETVTFVDSVTVRVSAPLTGGEEVLLARHTNNAVARHLYPDRSYIAHENLDGNQEQVLFLDQEQEDAVVELTQTTGGNIIPDIQTRLNALEAEDILLNANKLDSSEKAQPKGVATLDAAGTIPASQIPPIALGKPLPVASEAAMLALVAETGDVAIRSDLVPPESFMLLGDPTVLASWISIGGAGAVVTVNGQSGTVALTTDDIPEGTAKYFSELQVTTSQTIIDIQNALSVSAGIINTNSGDINALELDKVNKDAHVADGTIHYTQTSINITEAQVSDLGNYEPAFTKLTAFNKNFGSVIGTVVQGNDVRLSDARTPLAHGHVEADITDLGDYIKTDGSKDFTASQNTQDLLPIETTNTLGNTTNRYASAALKGLSVVDSDNIAAVSLDNIQGGVEKTTLIYVSDNGAGGTTDIQNTARGSFIAGSSNQNGSTGATAQFIGQSEGGFLQGSTRILSGTPTVVLRNAFNGAFVQGRAVGSGVGQATLEATHNGTFAQGIVVVLNDTLGTNVGHISATSPGAFAQGNVFINTDLTQEASIQSNGFGSFAQGSVRATNSNIIAEANGAFAQGYIPSGGLIEANAQGSNASGLASNLGVIRASGEGANAGGDSNGGLIEASSNGSIANGSCGSTKTIEATQRNAVQYGEGINNNRNSLKTGTGIHIHGDIVPTGTTPTTDGTTIAPLVNGMMWLDSAGDILIRTGGVTKNLSNII